MDQILFTWISIIVIFGLGTLAHRDFSNHTPNLTNATKNSIQFAERLNYHSPPHQK